MNRMNDVAVGTTGVVGTIASWSLSGALSVLATICTLIVVGPKAWEQLMVWWLKYEPALKARLSRLFKR